ncbi:UbiA family prenyltransferase [Streptomyces marispadix]|uniref:UbiA family prenyltransferase n=1 Tax=Streptomyces marispadix TaxID=2922868 RepID=A0ABS9SWU5_9ACTN|nr:UbiA family prenyltransferase [Streptomyces marispadix]MCH6160762.1 UbiA family prenyltransferase [Streptomyces marispadix]
MTAHELEHISTPVAGPGTRDDATGSTATTAGSTTESTNSTNSSDSSDSSDSSGSTGGRTVRACKAHIETWRPYTLAYPGLVGLTGAALSSGDAGTEGPATMGRLLVAWAAPTLGWVSGHYLGDWFDRALDAISKPQRPLPSGRLSPRTALVCGVGCAVAAAVAAASVNWRTVVLFGVAMLGIVAYSRLLKGRGLTGNAVRGALTATTVVFGAMTVTDLPSWQVLLFAGAFFAQDTASNLVGALRDVEGDRRGGCLTLPVRRGVRAAVRTAAALHAAALATAVAALSVGEVETPAGEGFGASSSSMALSLALLLGAVACGAVAFLPLLREGESGAPEALDPRRALRAHEVLVAERMLLAGALLACGWGPLPALLIVVPLLGLSLVAQSRMRSRHEFPGPDGTVAHSSPVRDLRGDVTSC